MLRDSDTDVQLQELQHTALKERRSQPTFQKQRWREEEVPFILNPTLTLVFKFQLLDVGVLNL
jgi:hypothetical protein